MRKIEHWIGGSETTGASTRTAPVWNPATGEQQAEVVLAEAADVDAAVAAAGKAFEEWRDVAVVQRARVMFAFRELVERHTPTSWPGWSPTSTARSSPTRWARSPAAWRSWSSPAASRTCSRASSPSRSSTGVDSCSFRQPLGVVAGITPFNFPVMVPMWMHPVAIACRQHVRPQAQRARPVGRPTSSAELYAEAGLPDGVYNVVHGDKVAVDAILDHPEIAAVSFVGSTPDRAVHLRARHGTGKRVQALGGAKNHAVVLPDADLDFAAEHLVAAGYGSAGAALHGDLGRGGGRRRRRRGWSRRSRR